MTLTLRVSGFETDSLILVLNEKLSGIMNRSVPYSFLRK